MHVLMINKVDLKEEKEITSEDLQSALVPVK